MTSEESFGSDFIETTDEEGNVHVFEKIDEYEVEGELYALLIYQPGDDKNASPNGSHPHEPEDEEDDEEEDDDEGGYDEEVIIMKITKDDDGAQVFEAIDDEEEFQRVVKFIEKAASTDGSGLTIDFSNVDLGEEE